MRNIRAEYSSTETIWSAIGLQNNILLGCQKFISGRGALMKEAVTIRWIEYQSQFAVLRKLEQQFNFTKDRYFIFITPWSWCWLWPWWRPLSFVWLCLRIEIFHALPLFILSMFHGFHLPPMSMSYCSLITLKKKNPTRTCLILLCCISSSKVWKFGTRMADAVVVAWQCQWHDGGRFSKF